MSRLPTAACPCCRYEGDLTAFLVSDEARQAINALAHTNPVVNDWLKPLMLYVRLFAPVGEQMGFKQLTRLCCEVSEIVGKGTVVHRGSTYSVTPSQWQKGFDIVRECKTLNLPLTNHSYLLGVVGNLASERAAKLELRHERNLQSGQHRSSGYRPPSEPQGKRRVEMTVEERAQADAARQKCLDAAGLAVKKVG